MKLFLVAVIMMLSACATITRGTNDTLIIETEPPTADATLSNGLKCKTPCSLKMPRKENCIVKIEKDGYITVEVNVTPQIADGGSAGMAGNVLIGGLIGVAIDAGSGAMYDLKPNPITVRLEKLTDMQSVIMPPHAGIREKTIGERLQELHDLKEKWIITEDDYLRQKDRILNEL